MLRAAICGAGHWGTRLIESVQGKTDKIRFVTAVTRDPAGKRALADRFGLFLTTSYADVLADPNIDAVVVGLDPTAPSVRSLEESKLRPGHDITDPKSTVHLMPPIVNRNDKPVVGIVDGGELYDAMSAGLMDQGVCVFRNSARGTRALVRYIEARLYADALRNRQ